MSLLRLRVVLVAFVFCFVVVDIVDDVVDFVDV